MIEGGVAADGVALVELWRGAFVECLHRGHAVVANRRGEIVESWGNPEAVILPRSACKMLQALPLVESGAAASADLGSEQLALACASHNGGAIHTRRVEDWLAGLGLTDDDLRCGPQTPNDTAAREALWNAGRMPAQAHNNCSGKHTGFLTVTKHVGGGPEYVTPDHPVQVMVRQSFEEMTGETSPGHGIDGCSAPNFATTVRGLATAMARMADPADQAPSRRRAVEALYHAMVSHPDLVAGDGRACTELMRAMDGAAAIKTGAEGVFAAILPGPGLGVAVKIADGATRASECAMAALLVRLGVADPSDPRVLRRLQPRQLNRRGLDTGVLQPAAALAVP
ncbi:MAG: asparaginase [Pseudomonadota bacterium]